MWVLSHASVVIRFGLLVRRSEQPPFASKRNTCYVVLRGGSGGEPWPISSADGDATAAFVTDFSTENAVMRPR